MDRPHIAIVGCGFTGTSAFHQLVHRFPVGRITIFEASGRFGPGFPYQADESREYLINNTNDTMCMDPANRRAFVEWLHANPAYSEDLDEKGHLPRAVYGEFLDDTVRRTTREARRRGIEVDLVAAAVTDIDERADGRTAVRHSSGETEADAVLLATGRCPDHDLFNVDGTADGAYFPTHMPGTMLDGLPRNAHVYVMGASLSAYDVVNQMFSEASGCRFEPDGADRLRFVAGDNERRIWLCSRSGRMKKMQSRYPNPPSFDHLAGVLCGEAAPGEVTLEDLFELFERDASDAGAEIDRAIMADPYAGCATQEDVDERAAAILAADIDAAAAGPGSRRNFVVDYLDAAQVTLWDIFAARLLSPDEEARYRSAFETAMLSYAAPCPLPTAQKLLALMQSGRLHVMKGVTSVRKAEDGGALCIAHEHGTASAGFVINSTGSFDRRVLSARQSTLVQNLAQKGLMEPYRRAGRDFPGVEVDMECLRLPKCRSVYVANMFLWGPGFYVSSAIMMARLVERILEAIFDR